MVLGRVMLRPNERRAVLDQIGDLGSLCVFLWFWLLAGVAGCMMPGPSNLPQIIALLWLLLLPAGPFSHASCKTLAIVSL